MKRTFFSFFVLTLLLSACAPTQEITGYWVNKAALPKGPYKNIFIFVISDNKTNQVVIENQMADLIISLGHKVVLSSEMFPPKFVGNAQLTREQLAENIKKAGCDAVFVVALLDTKTETSYQPGSTYMPMSYGYYGNYYGYYNHYYPQVYSPGYYTTDKTYYIENNFYDVATDELLYSIQSKAINPSNLESWFKGYSQMLLYKLRDEGLIKKAR
jgi:hypothetical protein